MTGWKENGEVTLVGIIFRLPTPIETFEFLSLSSEQGLCKCSVHSPGPLSLFWALQRLILRSPSSAWASRRLDCVCTGKVTCHLMVIVISWSNPHSTTTESNFTTNEHGTSGFQ